MTEPVLANPVMQLTIAGAAQGVLRPPCLLSALAADYHVGQTPQPAHTTYRFAEQDTKLQ